MSTGGKILIIDDEPACRFLLSETLESSGFECQQACDGTEGLKRALGEDWDLVLCDILMPGINGIELVKMVKQTKRSLPVVMISAELKSETVKTAFREGAYDFIFKPFDINELEMTIMRALERSRLARENETYKLTLEQRVAAQAEQIRSLSVGSILSLARALEAKDPYTNGHSQRVAEYSVLIAQQMGLDCKIQEQVRIAGQLHDIGKIGLRESILNKPTKLNDEEYELMKTHPVIGAEILTPVMEPCVICGVRHHHERYDGRGYPDRLKGEEIPMEARILAVADTYDALTTNRAYRLGRNHDAALAEIDRCTGTQFDPKVATAFMALLQERIDAILAAIPPVQQWSFLLPNKLANTGI